MFFSVCFVCFRLGLVGWIPFGTFPGAPLIIPFIQLSLVSSLATLKKPPACLDRSSLGLVRPRPHLVHRNGAPTRTPPTFNIVVWQWRVQPVSLPHSCLHRQTRMPSLTPICMPFSSRSFRLLCNSLLFCLVVQRSHPLYYSFFYYYTRTHRNRTHPCLQSHKSHLDASFPISMAFSPVPLSIYVIRRSLTDDDPQIHHSHQQRICTSIRFRFCVRMVLFLFLDQRLGAVVVCPCRDWIGSMAGWAG